MTLVNEATKDTRKTKSNGEGVYQFSAVPTGVYTLTVERSGFGAYTENGIELHPNDARTLPTISLKVGSVNASVTVTAENEVIDTSERSSLITAEDIKRLSTVGRDVSELLKTQPGFAMLQNGLNNGVGSDPSVVGTGGNGLSSYVGNGAPGNGASVISDGANVTDPGNGSGQTQTVNMDMVAEVKIETSNFGADSAKGPTVITVVGKSGSSEYHGTVYGFARTSQLNTQDWYMKDQGLPQIPDRYIYPGFNVGGPVKIPGRKFNSDKKLVFNVGGEDYVQRDVYSYGSPLNSVITALVPTDQSTNAKFSSGEPGMRQGNFSQAELANYLGTTVTRIENHCTPSDTTSESLTNYLHVCAEPLTTDGRIVAGGQFANGAASFDPGAAALLNALFPLPTGPTTQGYNWRTLNLENPSLFQIRGRVDFNANDNNKVYGVYNTEYGRTTGIPEQIYYSPASSGGSLLGGLDTPGKIINTATSNTASLNYTHIFSVRATNEITGSISYIGDYFFSGNPSKLLKSTYNYPYNGIYSRSASCPNCGSDDIPQVSTYNVASLGDSPMPLAIVPDFSNGQYVSKKFLPSAGRQLQFPAQDPLPEVRSVYRARYRQPNQSQPGHQRRDIELLCRVAQHYRLARPACHRKLPFHRVRSQLPGRLHAWICLRVRPAELQSPDGSLLLDGFGVCAGFLEGEQAADGGFGCAHRSSGSMGGCSRAGPGGLQPEVVCRGRSPLQRYRQHVLARRAVACAREDGERRLGHLRPWHQ